MPNITNVHTHMCVHTRICGRTNAHTLARACLHIRVGRQSNFTTVTIVQQRIKIVNTIIIVLNVIKIMCTQVSYCSACIIMQQVHLSILEKIFYYNVQVRKWSGLQCSSKLNIGMKYTLQSIIIHSNITSTTITIVVESTIIIMIVDQLSRQ